MKLPQFEHRSSLRTWLFRICLNAASDYRRSAPVRREVATEPAEIDFLSGGREDVHEDSEARRRVGIAETILNKLPEAQRLVFVLFELEEMSGGEIAELLRSKLGSKPGDLSLEEADLRLVIEEDQAAGTYVYKTVNRRTGEIVRQIPQEEVLRLREDTAYLAGGVIRTKA